MPTACNYLVRELSGFVAVAAAVVVAAAAVVVAAAAVVVANPTTHTHHNLPRDV